MNFLDRFAQLLYRFQSGEVDRFSRPEERLHPIDLADLHCLADHKPSDARQIYDRLAALHTQLSGGRPEDPAAGPPEMSAAPLEQQYFQEMLSLQEAFDRVSRSLRETSKTYLHNLLDDRAEFAAWVHVNAERFRQIGMNEKLTDPKRCAALDQLIVKNLLRTHPTLPEAYTPEVTRALEELKSQVINDGRLSPRSSQRPGHGANQKTITTFGKIAEHALHWMSLPVDKTDSPRETRATLIAKLDEIALSDVASLDKGIAQAKAAFSARIFRDVHDARSLSRWFEAQKDELDEAIKNDARPGFRDAQALLRETEKILIEFHEQYLDAFEKRVRNLNLRLLTEAGSRIDAAIADELFDAVFNVWFQTMWKPPLARWRAYRSLLTRAEKDGLLKRDLGSIWQRREARHNLALGAAIQSISPDGDTVLRPDVSLVLLVNSRTSKGS